MTGYQRLSRGQWMAIAAGVVLLQALIEYAMGRTPICKCGYVKLWEGVIRSPGNSQHISDWYTFSHVIHGFIFYGLAHLLMPRAPVATRFVARTRRLSSSATGRRRSRSITMGIRSSTP